MPRRIRAPSPSPHDLIALIIDAFVRVFRWANGGGKLFILGVLAMGFGALFERLVDHANGQLVVVIGAIASVVGLCLAVYIPVSRRSRPTW